MDAQENHQEEETRVVVAVALGKELPHIPLDVAHDILVRLPVKSLLRFKAVCKSWHSLISNNHGFKKSHVNLATKNHKVSYVNLSEDVSKAHFYLNSIKPSNSWLYFTSIVKGEASDIIEGKTDNPFTLSIRNNNNFILGSCDGLLFAHNLSSAVLWNPSTRKRCAISWPHSISFTFLSQNYDDSGFLSDSQFQVLSGLGYDSSLDVYKAVIIIIDRQQEQSHMYIYSTGVGEWKEYDVDYDRDLAIFIYNFSISLLGLTVGGAPHDWVLSRRIIYIDMVQDEFKELPRPTTMSSWNAEFSISLAVLKGCLCVVQDEVGNHHSYKIWAMKEYGVTESWTELFVIRLWSLSLKPLGFTNNDDEIVLHINTWELVTYNLKTGIVKKVPSKKWLNFNVAAGYVDSLVSPCHNHNRR